MMLARTIALGALLLAAPSALADDIELKDPAGDDFGPGTYKYPTDAVYKRGSFDLREVQLLDKGDKVEVRVTVGATIEDPWNSKEWDGNGFSLQMVQIYIDTDNQAGSGHTETLPGLNATFAAEDAWDKVIILSPQGKRRLEAEIAQKAGAMKGAVVVPTRTTARGKTLIATIAKKDLGGAPSKAWGYQVVMQSNEGYPAATDLLSRKVNEYEGQHRFGGGSDHECDPHVLDALVGPAKGEAAEKDGQKQALSYECGPEGERKRPAVLPMVRLGR